MAVPFYSPTITKQPPVLSMKTVGGVPHLIGGTFKSPALMLSGLMPNVTNHARMKLAASAQNVRENVDGVVTRSQHAWAIGWNNVSASEEIEWTSGVYDEASYAAGAAAQARCRELVISRFNALPDPFSPEDYRVAGGETLNFPVFESSANLVSVHGEQIDYEDDGSVTNADAALEAQGSIGFGFVIPGADPGAIVRATMSLRSVNCDISSEPASVAFNPQLLLYTLPGEWTGQWPTDDVIELYKTIDLGSLTLLAENDYDLAEDFVKEVTFPVPPSRVIYPALRLTQNVPALITSLLPLTRETGQAPNPSWLSLSSGGNRYADLTITHIGT